VLLTAWVGGMKGSEEFSHALDTISFYV
jgi:hypothetical protein